MFDFIRTHQKLMQLLLLVLILPSFVVVGVSSYKSFDGAANAVATVADQPVTQAEWENAQRTQMERYRQALGAQFDPKMFETPDVKLRALEDLVSQKVMNVEIGRANMTVSEEVLRSDIGRIKELQKPDGSFDVDIYKALLAARGMTPAMFEQSRRHDMAVNQLNAAIQESAFAPRTVAKRLSDINEQEREAQEIIYKADDFAKNVNVTEAMVKAYYDKNGAQFQLPEQARIEYLVFDQSVVESQVSVSDAEVKAYYEANQKRFESPEQRRASHILVAVKKDAPAAEKSAAKAKAEAILAEVKKTPADFAKIAKAKSDDKASAELGGDLDIVEKGAFVKPVEDAIFKLKQGEISGLVESEYGFHIITVTALKPSGLKSFDEAKAEIAAELKKQKMGKKYSELAEAFTNTVYEQSDSLKPAADKLKLTIQTATLNGRTALPGSTAPTNNAKFLKAIFSDDAIKNKRNTEAVEVGSSTMISGRIVEYKPASKRPLAEVAEDIKKRVTMEEAVKLAKKAGDDKIAAAKGGDAAGFGEAKIVSRVKQPPFNQTGALAVLKADVSKLPAVIGVELPGQGYAVYRITKVSQPAEQDKARREAEAQQIAGAMGQAELFGYVDALKAKAKAKINIKASDIKTEQPAEAPAK
ncbi:SurA N-terminal domain-containing protein [Massilia sp. TS11]|uniref:SurA N-terminal domain-containing protein n=1 Tax=Massilia sp. TS11 TaxID=2908003 RepID=UPI001EDA91EE|nr:SurA N-terminal domain-containing protein [Massilia sp. TS11]MCG2584675.1 SurA N-terminal domain-containing protein [Massilia sp. TS11]